MISIVKPQDVSMVDQYNNLVDYRDSVPGISEEQHYEPITSYYETIT